MLPRISRRRFMGMTAAFAAVAGLGSLADIVPNRSVVRPPGVVDENRFLEKCIRCGACADSCPVRGIGFGHMEDGLRNIGTPLIRMPDGYCMVYRGLEVPAAQIALGWKKGVRGRGDEEQCFACVDICPSGALTRVDATQLKMGTAVVRKEYCTAWRYGSCTFPCIDVCPTDAISLRAGPVVDADKCVGCNQCSFVCVVRAMGPTGIMVEPVST